MNDSGKNDANGNLTVVENPDGEGYTTLYAYDENGNLIKVTDPRGNSRTAEYDALNRQTVTVNEEGGRVEFSYDALGRITKVVNEDKAVTEYEYDAKGRVTGIKDAYGNYKYFTYDPMDRVASVTDENGVERKYAYDFKGNLTKYTDGLGNSETYAYDANDNRISVTNRNGETYTYTYDALNRVTSETDPKGNTKSFTYDKDSRITAVKDRNGNTTKYVLDGNGNIVETIDAAGTSSAFTYDSMDRLTKIRVHRVDKTHKVDEYQETLYTYDHRGLVKTEVNAKGDGKVFVYDGNGNLIQKTDEDGYVTEYEYSPVNLVSNINYNDAKSASYAYNGTGELIEMDDWNGKTSIGRDLLNRVVKVTDHNGREVEYGWDNVGNKTVQGYPDGTQVDYYYDAENQIVEMKDFDGGITKFEYDANGNKTFKEYPNYETAYYFYDECDQIIEMDEYNLGGKKLFKTTYGWDAEGNRLSEMQYNHGQSGTSGNGNGNGNNGNGNGNGNNGNGNNAVISGALSHAANVLDSLLEGGNSGTTSSQDTQNTPDTQSVRTTLEAPAVEIPSVDTERLSTETSIVNSVALPDPTAGTAAGIVLGNQADMAEELNEQLQSAAAGAETLEPEAETPELLESSKPETGKEDATIEGNGDGNGQVPPGQTEDEDGNIVNPGGHMPPGLNRGEKGEKPDNPNKPEKPDNPGTEDNTDKQANKANKGTHKYTYDELNRMITSNIAGTTTTYTYDTLGSLVLEKSKNHVVDYQYNELNQLVQKKDGNESYTYTYDKRGNRTAEIGKKASRSYIYDETNRMVEGTNWKGDKSAYTYNGLGLRINNTQTTHAGKVYTRDYVIDYTSFENDDLMVFAEGNGQLEYEQKHVYAGSERIEQFTDKGNWERTLYVHEDVMGNTRYYTKANGQSFAELIYDTWGMPESPNKLLNNDHGNYVFATFTGHIYDTTLDVYFAEARFYDANNRSWLAMDPVKDGLNWYQYCYSNPTTYYDPLGLWGTVTSTKQALLAGSEIEPALFWRQKDFFQGHWWQNEDDLTTAYKMLLKESKSRNMTIITLAQDYDYFDYFGYANTRLYTLQALIGTGRTGTYEAETMTALRAVLISQYAEFDLDTPELTPDNIRAIRNWYNNSSEIGKQGTYYWENGWGNIITGIAILGVGIYAGRPVKVSSVNEGSLESGTLSNVDARRWYLEQESKIPDLIDKNLSLEEQARQAFDLRNQFRTQARELMSDRALAESLYITDPNLTWEQIVEKQIKKGMVGDDVYRAIIESSQHSRASVNQSLGVE